MKPAISKPIREAPRRVLREFLLQEMCKIEYSGRLSLLQEPDVWRHSKQKNFYKPKEKNSWRFARRFTVKKKRLYRLSFFFDT
jgi:hypothetical protein